MFTKNHGGTWKPSITGCHTQLHIHLHVSASAPISHPWFCPISIRAGFCIVPVSVSPKGTKIKLIHNQILPHKRHDTIKCAYQRRLFLSWMKGTMYYVTYLFISGCHRTGANARGFWSCYSKTPCIMAPIRFITLFGRIIQAKTFPKGWLWRMSEFWITVKWWWLLDQIRWCQFICSLNVNNSGSAWVRLLME